MNEPSPSVVPSAPQPGSPSGTGDGAGEALRAETRHQLATDLVLGVFRTVRGYQLHANNNASLLTLVNYAAQVLTDYCARAGTQSATLTFTASTVFVDGRQLRARREAYASALELGALLDRCGVSELVLPVAAGRTDLGAFARAFSDALRNPGKATPIGEFSTGGIRLRRVQIDLDAAGRDSSPTERALGAYASAVVVVRRFLDRVTEAPTHLPNQLKRVAQKLVSQLEDDPRLLVGMTAAGSTGADEATVSVNTAILAAATGRQVINDRVVLANLAMAAMLMHTGRTFLTTVRDPDDGARSQVARRMAPSEATLLPSVTTRCLVALGRIHAPNIVRTAVIHEALWLRHGDRLGPLYGGRRTASVLARILVTARAFCDLMTHTPGAPVPSVDDALQRLQDGAVDATERTFVKLLVGALGILPVGTVVELNTGEVGVVMATPRRPIDFARPPVRVMYDLHGSLLGEPFEIDLAARPAEGQPTRVVRRPIETDEQQMKAMRSYVLSLAGRGRGVASQRSPSPPPGATGSVKTAPGLRRLDTLADPGPVASIRPASSKPPPSPGARPAGSQPPPLPHLRPAVSQPRAPASSTAVTPRPPRPSIESVPDLPLPDLSPPASLQDTLLEEVTAVVERSMPAMRPPPVVPIISTASPPPPPPPPPRKLTPGVPRPAAPVDPSALRPSRVITAPQPARPTRPTATPQPADAPPAPPAPPPSPAPEITAIRPSNRAGPREPLTPAAPRLRPPTRPQPAVRASPPQPSSPSEAPLSLGEITREVAWVEYEHLVVDTSTSTQASTSEPPPVTPGGEITREVPWHEYERLLGESPSSLPPVTPPIAPPVRPVPHGGSRPPPAPAPAREQQAPEGAPGDLDAMLLQYLLDDSR